MAGKLLLCAIMHKFIWSTKRRELLGLSKVSFHSFPKDKNILKKWIIKIKRDPGLNFVINQYIKICSEHFTSGDYFPTSDKPNSRHRLKPNAVPSVKYKCGHGLLDQVWQLVHLSLFFCSAACTILSLDFIQMTLDRGWLIIQ